MKIELDVEAAELKDTIAETLRSLPQEKREAMAERVIEKILTGPDEALANYAAHVGYGWQRDELIKNYKSPQRVLFQEVAKGMTETYSSRITKLVEGDTELRRKYEGVRDAMVASFPEMVRDAMTAWFAAQFQDLAASVMNLHGNVASQKILLDRVTNQLNIQP